MKYDRITFKVIPEAKVVVAEINETSRDAVNTFNYKFLEQSTASLWINALYGDNRFLMPYKFKAVAKCHGDDKFDEEVGKNIARKKLVNKYNKSLNKHLANIHSYMGKALMSMDEYFENKEF